MAERGKRMQNTRSLKDASDDASTSAKVVQRVIASPLQTKTQTAKLNYGHSVRARTPTERQASTSPVKRLSTAKTETSLNTPRTVQTAKTQEDFQRRKREREREIQEIQSMLNEIGKPSHHAPVENRQQNAFAKTETAPPKGTAKPAAARTGTRTINTATFRRHKTELLIERPKALTTRRDLKRDNTMRTRSRSSQPPTTKSHELMAEGSTASKQGYVPDNARRFMEEQKKRKRSSQAAASLNANRDKSALEKEQIKKRLEELRKNTRKIFDKTKKKREIDPTAKAAPKEQGQTIDIEIVIREKQQEKAKADEATKSEKSLKIEAAEEVKVGRASEEKSSVKETSAAIKETSADIKEASAAIKEASAAVKEVDVVVKEATVAQTPALATNPLVENQKRIGLLRKPELKDHSFSAIKEFSFDKENVALEMMTPHFVAPLESKLKVELPNRIEEEREAAKELPAPSKFSAELLNRNSELLTQNKTLLTQNSELLKHSIKPGTSLLSLHEKATQAQETKHAETETESEATRQKDLHYWLKPTSVQVYPYNFIMAVRRKLDAIANPPPQLHTLEAGCHKTTSTRDIPSKKSVETPLTSVPKERLAEAQKNVKRRIMADIEEASSAENSFATHILDKFSQGPTKETFHKSQTFSDLNSNFSSISIKVPSSNTVSEVSSLKSEIIRFSPKRDEAHVASEIVAEAQKDDDDTTISSSIFSSPEKKKSRSNEAATAKDFQFLAPRPLSPLSLTRVEHLKIAPKNKIKQAIDNKHINAERGDATYIKATSVPEKLAERPKEIVDNAEISINFNQLLDDFNRSLSQVIQVNEQLKSTLDKSQQMCSSAEKKSQSVKSGSEDYSTDFEAATNTISHAVKAEIKPDVAMLKKRADEMEANLLKRKKTLFEITNVVKPLLTSPKSQTDSIDNSPEQLGSELELNIASITNSSARSSDTRSIEIVSIRSEEPTDTPTTFEKRLQVIEQLKTDLKQSILDSQVARKEKERAKTTPPKKLVEQPNKSASLSEPSELDSPMPTYSMLDLEIKTIYPPNMEKMERNASSASSIATLSSKHGAAAANKSSTEAASSASSTPQQQYCETFLVGNGDGSSKSNSAEKYISESITEEIQNEYESSSKENQNGNQRVPGRTPHKHDAYIESHINTSRGDQLPKVDLKNTISTEKHILAEKNAAENSSGSAASAAPPVYEALEKSTVSEKSDGSVQKLKTPTKTLSNKTTTTTTKTPSTQSIGSEIAAIFNQSEADLSILSSRHGSGSDSSLSYSSVGLYEKLIKNETTKSEHLTALLKMREKALLDRTKGQIAWLEVQKERYKAKGLMLQITTIKKKQRAILLKMEKEREEIKRLLQTTTSTSSTQSSKKTPPHTSIVALPQMPTKPKKDNHRAPKQQELPSTPPPALLPPAPPLHKATTRSSSSHLSEPNSAVSKIHSAPIVRANYDLESSRSLEELLRKREVDLQRRREHVTRLMQWHQRLDQEEAEVLQLERMLLNCNKGSTHASKSSQKDALSQASHTPTTQESVPVKSQRDGVRKAKMERRLKEIDRSLQELNSISSSNNNTMRSGTDTPSSSSAEPVRVDFVRTTGTKLNKLWRRLTSQQVEKYEPNRRYKLCKADLEQLYEDAKLAVLRDFAQDEERITAELLEQSSGASIPPDACSSKTIVVVPQLNLNFSTGPSDAESVAAASTRSLPLGNIYRPSAAEENFQLRGTRVSSGSTTSISTVGEEEIYSAPIESVERQHLIELNTQKFHAISEHLLAEDIVLQRSFSDTQIAELPSLRSSRIRNRNATTSQRDIASHESRPPILTAQSMSRFGAISPVTTLPSTDTMDDVQSLLLSDVAEALASIPAYQKVASSASSTTLKTADISVGQSTAKEVSTIASMVSTFRASSIICSVEKLTDSLEASSLSMVKTTETANTDKPKHSTEDAIPKSPPSGRSATSNSNTSLHTVSSEDKARQIAEKLERISEAVSQLSQSNSLGKSGNTAATKSATASEAIQTKTSISSNATVADEPNLSTDASYSCHFENISTDMQSPSGCTLKSSSKASAIASHSPIHKNGNESTASEQQSSTFNSKTFTTTSTQAPSQRSKTLTNTSPSVLNQSEAENRMLDAYEQDFESSGSSDATRIEDVSMPQFEFTIDTTALSHDDDDDVDVDAGGDDASVGDQDDEIKVVGVTRQQIERPSVITNVKSVDSKSPEGKSPEKQENSALLQAQSTAPPPPPPPPPATASTSSVSSSNVQLMPDIINELEIRRCQQILLENEHLKQYEHVTAVPYMYVREIPNKPPPPYVPPAHGSPMTTIFPSEDRIKDITYRRTHELYCELLNTDYTNDKGEKLPSVTEEKITNIYERIILDICREYLDEHQEVLSQGDPTNFHSQLAFFNPPDRLRCIQASIYKEVRRCLAMDKTPPKRTQVYSVYGQRAKRDHIGKIIIQEMYDEDEKWCNFHREESEVLELIVEEMIGNTMRQLAKEVLLEEGGTVEDDEVGEEEQEAQEAEPVEATLNQRDTEANVHVATSTEAQQVSEAEVQVNEEM